ncbi:MAG: hypothetical protein Tsb0014_46740 [Pleurocapsa sp.]
MSAAISSDASATILCVYKNRTQKIQIAKLFDTSVGSRERMIFPAETLLFEVSPNANLAIYIELNGKPKLLDNIPCSTLRATTLYKNLS